jgi:hypothetical protein
MPRKPVIRADAAETGLSALTRQKEASGGEKPVHGWQTL